MRTEGSHWTLAIPILGALLLGLVSWRLLFLSSMPRPLPDVYLELPPGEAPALAPDRALLAYLSRHGDDWMLHLRELEGGGVTRLAGTEGARSPFFSADGKFLAFVSSGSMKALLLGGNNARQRDLASVGEVRGARWEAGGSIVFGSSEGVSVLITAGASPEIEMLARPAEEDGARLGFPQALPESGWIVFEARRGSEGRIEAIEPGSGKRHEILADALLPRYAAPGRLLFLRDSTICGIRFDPMTARTVGDPVMLVSDVESGEDAWYDLSSSGTLAFRRPSGGRADARVAFGVVSNWLAELERLLPRR